MGSKRLQISLLDHQIALTVLWRNNLLQSSEEFQKQGTYFD